MKVVLHKAHSLGVLAEKSGFIGTERCSLQAVSTQFSSSIVTNRARRQIMIILSK